VGKDFHPLRILSKQKKTNKKYNIITRIKNINTRNKTLQLYHTNEKHKQENTQMNKKTLKKYKHTNKHKIANTTHLKYCTLH